MLVEIARPVIVLLRLEGAVAALAGLVGYRMLADGWALFAIFALVPDLSFLGYLLGPRIGARVYNLAHTYLVPAVLACLGLWLYPTLLPVACVWLTHIGVDRALGYGLKSEAGFQQTHLGRIGHKRG